MPVAMLPGSMLPVDLALPTGLIFLYSKLGRSDYVMIAALTLIFSIMTSYARARAKKFCR